MYTAKVKMRLLLLRECFKLPFICKVNCHFYKHHFQLNDHVFIKKQNKEFKFSFYNAGRQNRTNMTPMIY